MALRRLNSQPVIAFLVSSIYLYLAEIGCCRASVGWGVIRTLHHSIPDCCTYTNVNWWADEQ